MKYILITITIMLAILFSYKFFIKEDISNTLTNDDIKDIEIMNKLYKRSKEIKLESKLSLNEEEILKLIKQNLKNK